MIDTGIRHLLEGSCYAVAGMVHDVAALPNPCPGAEPDLFIIAGGNCGEQTLETVRLLRTRHSSARIAVIADHFDLAFVRLGHAAGVHGFCLSGSSRDVLIKSLELISLGEEILPPVVMTSLLNGSEAASAPKSFDGLAFSGNSSEAHKKAKLSPREAEVLRHLMEGAANKVIARELDVAEVTVKVHVKTILRKIGAANRTQAAMWASAHLPGREGLAGRRQGLSVSG
ncbi:LuxR C-terminal-related transcriptional regulator [Microvirga makkahensis]|uniref:HTH luxR-type domain-containing protein n=1 Tax=Microvirga makkahensis TaxID=1128670 RepID=A0A7X3SN98_9HYPH|nr:response regulator transcription factor [Microvirga makkahensis]MXQ11166.1 hypothetical protein [Microvirga makkahensis]